jgi:hypothetical protein
MFQILFQLLSCINAVFDTSMLTRRNCIFTGSVIALHVIHCILHCHDWQSSVKTLLLRIAVVVVCRPITQDACDARPSGAVNSLVETNCPRPLGPLFNHTFYISTGLYPSEIVPHRPNSGFTVTPSNWLINIFTLADARYAKGWVRRRRRIGCAV